jgi:hypothetical protein
MISYTHIYKQLSRQACMHAQPELALGICRKRVIKSKPHIYWGEKLSKNHYCGQSFLICGGANLPVLDWIKHKVMCSTSSGNCRMELFLK